eukprot:SAG22_NODE_1766_length_3623_cov_2.997162_2_plen_51_part_00
MLVMPILTIFMLFCGFFIPTESIPCVTVTVRQAGRQALRLSCVSTRILSL